MFKANEVKDACVQWIRDWFEENGKGCNAVLGISGGKDSSICAALCVEALGADRVIGVTMPNGVQPDIDDSIKLINHLGIKRYNVNIGPAFQALMGEVEARLGGPASDQTRINMAPRIRMTALYAISQSNNGRVVNTCNLSEDWVGYSTRYGDAAGDFSPLGGLTVAEVLAIGEVLGLPEDLVGLLPVLLAPVPGDDGGGAHVQRHDHDHQQEFGLHGQSHGAQALDPGLPGDAPHHDLVGHAGQLGQDQLHQAGPGDDGHVPDQLPADRDHSPTSRFFLSTALRGRCSLSSAYLSASIR